jgi:ANTAR domain
MERHLIDEDSAFAMLRERSHIDNRKLADLAAAVVEPIACSPNVDPEHGDETVLGLTGIELTLATSSLKLGLFEREPQRPGLVLGSRRRAGRPRWRLRARRRG